MTCHKIDMQEKKRVRNSLSLWFTVPLSVSFSLSFTTIIYDCLATVNEKLFLLKYYFQSMICPSTVERCLDVSE